MEQNTLYTAIGRLDRETWSLCAVLRWNARSMPPLHGGYAGNGRLDCPKLANF